MGMRGWMVGLLVLGSVGAGTPDRPSPAGLTTIVVRGKAQDVVLVDPRGRVDRSEPRKGDVPIPACTRWDGGTETTLDDSADVETDVEEAGPGNVVTQIELARPIVGRYRLYATATEIGALSVVVTPVVSTAQNNECPELRRDLAKGSGRYVWAIDFLSDQGVGRCAVRIAPATPSRRK